MTEYKIINNEELDSFIWECTQNGGAAIAIKGKPSPDATYSDGTPIANDWNLAWMDSVTRESREIIYAPICNHCGILGNVKQGDVCPICQKY